MSMSVLINTWTMSTQHQFLFHRFELLLLFLLVQYVNSERTLKFANVLYRHGDRTPIVGYPTDNYTEDTWPHGFGQLTERGMKQQFNLGQWLRHRYVTELKLLAGDYDWREVYVRSSPAERTIMSALSNLQGLFPTEGGGAASGKPPWHPVPVFSVDLKQDFMLSMSKTDCQAAQDFIKAREHNKAKQDYLKADQNFFDEVKVHAGFPDDIIFRNYSQLGDTLLREKNHGRVLPSWVDDETFRKLKATLDFAFEAEFQNMSVEEMKLTAGVLLTDMVTRMKDHLSGANNDSKLSIYSGHDTDVAPFLAMFNVFDNVIPPTAACVMLELYQEESGLYTVQLSYRNDTSKPPYILSMPECAQECPVHNFFHIASQFIVDDVEELCKGKPPPASLSIHWNLGWLLAASCLAIAAVLPLIACILLAVGFTGRRRLQSAKQRMEPINFHLLGGPNSESEDESVFDT